MDLNTNLIARGDDLEFCEQLQRETRSATLALAAAEELREMGLAPEAVRREARRLRLPLRTHVAKLIRARARDSRGA